jgi:hypothetical protein
VGRSAHNRLVRVNRVTCLCCLELLFPQWLSLSSPLLMTLDSGHTAAVIITLLIAAPTLVTCPSPCLLHLSTPSHSSPTTESKTCCPGCHLSQSLQLQNISLQVCCLVPLPAAPGSVVQPAWGGANFSRHSY